MRINASKHCKEGISIKNGHNRMFLRAGRERPSKQIKKNKQIKYVSILSPTRQISTSSMKKRDFEFFFFLEFSVFFLQFHPG